MKEYILKLENSLGNGIVATFVKVKDLIKHTEDNPPQRKYHYYMVVKETTETRVDMKAIKQFYS
ncbi:hypothetical protein GQ473_00315 [archaeon]|nr:hypothetical protein [archaeon]